MTAAAPGEMIALCFPLLVERVTAICTRQLDICMSVSVYMFGHALNVYACVCRVSVERERNAIEDKE